MTYKKEYVYIPVYEYVSTNQHGGRYKQTGRKRLSICRITAEHQHEHQNLILLGPL